MTEEEKRFTKEDAKAMSILDVASSLGMELKKVSVNQYAWVEHDSLKIKPKDNVWHWFSEGRGGDVIKLVQEIKGVSFKEAMHYLKTGEFPTVSIAEEKREPFHYVLAPYEQPFKEARTYLKEERGLSDETIDFFLEQGVLAQAMKKAQDGYLEPVIVFKSLDKQKKVIGASLQGITPNKERYEGKGYLKQILYNSDGLSGMSVDIGAPKRLVFAEAPIDLMSYYEAHRSVLSDVRLVAMNGLKPGIIARYTMELFAELEGVKDYQFDPKKVDTVLKAFQTVSFFKEEKNQNFITLAVDNDKAGRNFITILKEREVPLTIDIPPILQENKAKEDWNDYLKMGLYTLENLYHVYSSNDDGWKYQGYFPDFLAEQKIKELTTDEVVAFRSSRQLTHEEIKKEVQLARADSENTVSQSNVVEEKRDNSRLAQARRKLERLNNEFSEATNTVYSHSSRANGQPMNDKRDGASYFRRQEQLENRVFSTLDEIKKQEERVEHLERQADFKARGLNRQGTGLEMSVDNIPRIKEAIEKFDNGKSDFTRATIKRYRQELIRLEAMRDRMASTVISPGAQHLIDKGLVSQWKKRPTLYFVKGLRKVAFELGEDGRFQVSKKYAPQTGAEQEEVERLLSEQSVIETNKEQSEIVQESTKDEVVSERNFEQQEEKQEELTMKQEDVSTIEKAMEASRQPRDTVRPEIDDAPTFKVEPVKSVVIGAEEIEELVSKTDNDATEKAELLSEERQQEAIPTPKYLHRIDIDGVELVNDSGHFSTLDEANDWLLTHFMDQVDRGAAGEGYFKTDLTLTFVSRDGELEEFKDRLDIGFGSRSFTPNHQDLFIYLNKSYADYFEERGFILETTAKEVEQKRVQELLQHPIFRDSTNAIDYLLENYVTSQELEMLIVYFENESQLPVSLTQVQYGLTEVQDTLNIDAFVTGFEQNTADWERGLEYVRRYWSHYQNISEEEIYQIHKRFQHPVFRYSSDTISRLRSNSVSSQELDALIARFEREENLPIPLFTATTALEEIRELSEEKSHEQAQGQEKNAEGTIGDFPEYQKAAPLPEANQSQPLNDLSPNQTQPQPYLHFTINEEGKSIDKRHYHAISDGELVKLNRYASNLQQAANWYLDTVAGSKIIYFYQEGDVVNSLQVTFDRDKFLHLTGVFPYKEGQTAEQSLLDFAQGKGAFDAILLANKGAAFDKLKVLPELSAITDANSFYFGDLSDVPKLHSLDMSKAIKSGDEDIVLALRTADHITFPASLMKLREGLKIQLDHSQQERTILGVYRDRDGVINQLSINEEYVKDGGQEMLSILENKQYEEARQSAHPTVTQESLSEVFGYSPDVIVEEKPQTPEPISAELFTQVLDSAYSVGDPRKLGLQVPEESQVAWERYYELSDSHEGNFTAVVDAADQLGLVDKNSNFYQEWNQDRIYNEDYHVRLQWAERRPNGPHVPFQDGDLIDYKTFVEALYKENQAYYQKHQDSKRIADPVTNEGYLPYTKTKFDVYAPGGMLIAENVTYDLADETEPISRLFGLRCRSLEDQAELAAIDEAVLSQLESQELGQEITKETRASSLKETPAQGQGRDTDGDGVSDTVERSLGTDPYDAASTPYHRAKEEEKQVSNFPQKTLVDILNEKDTKALSDHLKQGMREYMNSDQYKNFLTAMSHFHDYSVKNIQLILAQNPAATRVASYQTWKEHFGRQVQKGEKGMKIFIPIQVKIRDENGEVKKDENGQEMTATRFKLGTVFDVKQTEGKELPKPLHLLEGTVPDYETLYRASRQVSLDNHVPISFKEIESEANGYYNVETKEIVIAEKQMSEAQIMKTLFHEMAHSRLHHPNDSFTATERELQAESIAYIVASHYGIDTSDYSFAYLHLWSDDQKNYSDLEAQLKIIQTESKQLMKEIDARFSQIKSKSKAIDKFQSKLEKTTAEMKTAIEQKRAEEKFQMAKKLPAPHKEH